jgi:hypothetical protein
MYDHPSKTTDSESKPSVAQCNNPRLYIRRVLGLLYPKGSVAELRCLKTKYGTISGYFDDFDKLAAIAADLSGDVPAVYVTLNPVNDALLARANNRIERYAKATSGDVDIVKRCWLPIDFDPVRPADISSSDEEKASAMGRAEECRAWLTALGFPAGVFADSGNGAHLLYRIELPNDDASRALIQKCLEALAVRFTDDRASVDLKNFNAARIWKLYGTLACKGDDMPDRPHREAKIIEGRNPGIVSVELLQKLADLVPEPQKHQSANNGHYQAFNLDDFISRHCIGVKFEKTVAYGRLLILEQCPFNPADHNHGEAHIVQRTDGALGFACKHNSCSYKHWGDVRELYEPGYRERRNERYHSNGSAIHETLEPLQDKDLPVSCIAEEGERELNTAFPEIAWSGLFARWRETVEPRTEAPLEFIWAAFLLATGMIIGRSAYRESPRPLYPNFYLLFLGATGDSRKSTALGYTRELLHHVGEDFKDLDGVVSSEGIYEGLAASEGTKGLIYADEFRALLSVAKRKGTQDIIPRLNSLYYCPERASIDRVKDSTEIIKPFVSLVAATPKAYVEDILSNLEVEGGFINRFLIVSGEEQPPKSLARRLPPFPWGKFIFPLQTLQGRDIGHLDFTEEAADLWDTFYTKWKLERRTWPYQQTNLTARIFEHVLKIAIIYAVLGNEEKITARTLAVALAIGEWLQSNTLRIFADIGLDHFSKCEQTIVEVLKRAKDTRTWRRDLQRAMASRGFNGELFNRAMKALESNDHIHCYDVVTGAGRKRPVVEYVHETRDR